MGRKPAGPSLPPTGRLSAGAARDLRAKNARGCASAAIPVSADTTDGQPATGWAGRASAGHIGGQQHRSLPDDGVAPAHLETMGVAVCRALAEGRGGAAGWQAESAESGDPQGGVVSPQLANLFVHYTFDMRMQREFPSIPCERYPDDAVCHLRMEAQARHLKERLEGRFAQCRLELYSEKTKIVYCKDDNRAGDFPHTKFDFLGYTFRSRRVKSRSGKLFLGLSPEISARAAKGIRQEVRSWALQRRTGMTLHEIADAYNPVIRGLVNYYRAFHKSALAPTLNQTDRKVMWWAQLKYKRLRRRKRQATHWLRRIALQESDLFVHWSLWSGGPGQEEPCEGKPSRTLLGVPGCAKTPDDSTTVHRCRLPQTPGSEPCIPISRHRQDGQALLGRRTAHVGDD